MEWCPYWCRSKTTFENLTKQSILDPPLHPQGRVQAVDNIFLHFTQLAFGVKTISLSLTDLNRSLMYQVNLAVSVSHSLQ